MGGHDWLFGAVRLPSLITLLILLMAPGCIGSISTALSPSFAIIVTSASLFSTTISTVAKLELSWTRIPHPFTNL